MTFVCSFFLGLCHENYPYFLCTLNVLSEKETKKKKCKIFLDKFPGAVKINPFCLAICTSFSHMVLFTLSMHPFIFSCRFPVFVNSLDDPLCNYPYAEHFHFYLKKVL